LEGLPAVILEGLPAVILVGGTSAVSLFGGHISVEFHRASYGKSRTAINLEILRMGLDFWISVLTADRSSDRLRLTEDR